VNEYGTSPVCNSNSDVFWSVEVFAARCTLGRKSWKLIAQTINPTPSLFVDQRPSTYSQGNMDKFGETRSGVGKSGVLAHKSGNISETPRDRGKVTMEDIWELTNERTMPDLLRPPLLQDWGFATPPKISIAII